MTREQALAIADKLVAEWTGQVKNERGYAHDRWKPTDLGERTEAVLKLAAFLLVPSGPLVAPLKADVREVGPAWTIYGWHPGLGAPSRSVYNAAIQWRNAHADTPVLAAEAEAISVAIAMYEEANLTEIAPDDGRLLCAFCLQPRGEYAPDACITPSVHRQPA